MEQYVNLCFFRKDNNKLYIFALALGVLLCLSGCKSSELKVLENSASIIQLHKGIEVSRTFQDKKDVVISKPVYAKARVEYEPIDNYTKRDVFDEIVAILERNNWIKDEWNIDPDSFSASLKKGEFKILTTVLMHSDKNLVTIYMEVQP